MKVKADRIITLEPVGVADFDTEHYRRFVEAMVEASISWTMFGEACIEFSRALIQPDETGGMTLDELLPEIDTFLAEYRQGNE